MASKSHQWFKSYSHFTEGVEFARWWSFIGKGLRLQPAQKGLFKFDAASFAQICVKLKIQHFLRETVPSQTSDIGEKKKISVLVHSFMLP